jgi:hypothetical protein
MNPPFPTFRITSSAGPASGPRLLGVVSSTQWGGGTWIADGYLGYLKHGSTLVLGRWHRRDEHWEFVPERPEHLTPVSRVAEFEVLDGYWGERAELVLDRALAWTHDEWSIEGDHDHCAICWAAISTTANRGHFVSSGRKRVCEPCYREYVSARALGFVVPAPGPPA